MKHSYIIIEKQNTDCNVSRSSCNLFFSLKVSDLLPSQTAQSNTPF